MVIKLLKLSIVTMTLISNAFVPPPKIHNLEEDGETIDVTSGNEEETNQELYDVGQTENDVNNVYNQENISEQETLEDHTDYQISNIPSELLTDYIKAIEETCSAKSEEEISEDEEVLQDVNGSEDEEVPQDVDGTVQEETDEMPAIVSNVVMAFRVEPWKEEEVIDITEQIQENTQENVGEVGEVVEIDEDTVSENTDNSEENIPEEPAEQQVEQPVEEPAEQSIEEPIEEQEVFTEPSKYEVIIDTRAYEIDDDTKLFQIETVDDKLVVSEIEYIVMQEEHTDTLSISFTGTDADYMLTKFAKPHVTDFELLAPDAIISVEQNTETPEMFTTEAVEDYEKVIEPVKAYLTELDRELCQPIILQKVNFIANEDINKITDVTYDSETGEEIVNVQSGNVYLTAYNIDYDLSEILYFEAIWVSENLDEVRILNHSVIGNDIYFDMKEPGYIFISEVQWRSADEPKSPFSLSNLLDGFTKTEPSNAAIMLASATTQNNTAVTVSWVGDTVGSRASNAYVHIIHGVLTVNGVAPDENGNVNVTCIYGSTPETQDTCFKVKSDVPADVDWEALNDQAEQIAELKAKLGITEGNLVSGQTFNSKIKTLANGGTTVDWSTNDSNITSFQRSNTAPATTIAAASTGDISAAQDGSVVAWYDNGAIYWYSADTSVSAATDASAMFCGLTSATTINLSGISTFETTNFNNMFAYSSSITTLDMSSFSTSNGTNFNNMFAGCSGLTTLNLSNLLVDHATNMYSMFKNCSNLTTLNISTWDTMNVTDFREMFRGCTSLTTLDIGNFDMEKAAYVNTMFQNCSNLTTIYVSPTFWNIPAAATGSNMFDGCTSIVGGASTTYDANHVDKTYAHIDSASNPGYLTAKSGGA